MAFCMKCGTQLPDEAAFCIKCGAKLPEVEIPTEPNNDFEDKKEIKEVTEEVISPTLSFSEVSNDIEEKTAAEPLADNNDDDDNDGIVRNASYDEVWEEDDEEDATLNIPEVNTSAEALSEETTAEDVFEEEDISQYFAGPDDDIEPPEEILPEEDGMTIEELSAAKRYHEELKAEHSNFIQNRLNLDPIEDDYFNDILPDLEEELRKINWSPIITACAIFSGLCLFALYLIVAIPS